MITSRGLEARESRDGPKAFLGNGAQKDGAHKDRASYKSMGGPRDAEKLQMSRYPENRPRMKSLGHIEVQINKTQQHVMF